ncbi:lantibiotic dehydratase [Pseudoalteromonas xiamenensis]
MSNALQHDNFFVIRTPRLSLTTLHQLADKPDEFQEQLNDWLEQDEVKEALYAASPSLLERVAQWRAKPDSKQGKKVAQALLKYLIRMASRPTPFGLFSGITLGQVAEQTSLISGSFKQDSRKTRLDMFFLSALKEHVIKHYSRAESLQYRLNPSHYFIENQCRYIESYLSEKEVHYRLSAIESDEYFTQFLELAKHGSSFERLVNEFVALYSDVEREEVEEYIQSLIDEGILIADVPLPLTGESPDLALYRSLVRVGANSEADSLATALSLIEQLDQQGFGDISKYKALITHLEGLGIRIEENKLLQSDVYRQFEQCSLSAQELTRVQRTLELVSMSIETPSTEALSAFMSAFQARFEGQFVRLDQILDDETGIGISSETGYEAPLVAGLQLARSGGQDTEKVRTSPLQKLIEEELTKSANRSKSCITISSKQLKEVAKFKSEVAKIPYSTGAMLSLFEDENERPVFKYNGCYGPSAANLLGRFCHLNETLQASVTDHLAQEQQHMEDVILAEVVHMPDGRPGNVIARPHLRPYEIVFMADSSVDLEYQIPLSDLYVWVEGQTVKLWSKRLNKRIIPRLSSAHNYGARSLSAYKFLCMLQSQEGSTPAVMLPKCVRSAAFVPRIMIDNLVVFEKTWRVERKKLEAVFEKGILNTTKLNAFLEEYQLDRWVSFSSGDNVLRIDLTHPEMLSVLIGETTYHETIELTEVLTTSYRSRVRDASGNQYNNEVIVPLFNTSANPPRHFAANPQANITAAPIKRRFSAGSEWLSLKIYSGNTVVEQLLTETLMPFIQAHKALFEKWFFIRYGDPNWHLRLRFHGEPSKLCGELLPKLNALLDPKVEAGVLHKVELMTYEREVERYGGPKSMELVEQLFMLDSELIAQTCTLVEELDESLRWRVAMLYTHNLFDLFGYSQETRFDLISNLRQGFGKEFNESAALRKKLGERYREYETTIDNDFAKWATWIESGHLDAELAPLFSLVAQWRDQAAGVVTQLKSLNANGDLNCSLNDLMGSLLHMHNNRMFKAYGREQELVVHDLMRRKYVSMKHGS